MVAMGHGLCMYFGVCGEIAKNKEESRIRIGPLELISSPGVKIGRIFGNRATYRREIVSAEKGIFLFTAQQIEKPNLDQVFSESRSGTIAHKN